MSQPDAPLDLAAIQARADAATEGEWWVEEDDRVWTLHGVHARIPSGVPEIGEQILNHQILKAPKTGTPYAEYWPDRADAEFIAHARADVPALLARVRQLETENERLAKHADELATEIAEGISAQTMLKGLTVEDGRVCLSIEPAREMLLILVASMREMLDDAGAENYLVTEATFPPEVSLDLQDGQHPEDSYTLTVQRRHRPTAHDLRRRAETERDEARAEADRLRPELAGMTDLRDRAITRQDQLRAENERLADTGRRALASLDDLIRDHTDPGVEALGARYQLAQALTGHPHVCGNCDGIDPASCLMA
ncbi:hypothetical protein ACFYUY_01700 [Kitasatospora sp. NPDC004745]|uniref:hypothetical protein n=1 Tax=Kitasatospora sp. NPDC004745 TaxID=3364019 RepID=UPI0036AB199E